MTDTLQLSAQPVTRGSSLGDLLRELGVSADRVQRYPFPGTATEEDFLHFNEKLGIPCELIDGTLVEMAMGSYESLVATAIATMLSNFVMPRKLGIVLGADSMFKLFGGNIRMPDVAFVPKSSFPSGLPKGPVWKIVPSLAVEVISASNTVVEINRKRAEFFTHGISVFWLIDPATRSAKEYDTSDPIEGKLKTDSIDGGIALPGVTLNLPELFSVMDL